MELKTEKYLLKLGISPAFIGFKYLCYAIDICRNDESMIYKRNGNLYKIMADDLNIRKGTIDRMMQYALDKSPKPCSVGEFLAKAIIDLR